MISNKNLPIPAFKFYCNNCDYGTSKKSSFDEHLLTSKHKKSIVFNKKSAKTCSKHNCEFCEKEYKDYSGLWRHKKKCSKKEEIKNIEPNKDSTDKELIMILIKENAELKNMMMDVIKNGTNNNTNFVL